MTSIDNPFEYVKNNLPISEAIYILEGRRPVPGKKTNCPSCDHADEHPSCDIDKDDRLFSCKSCGAGGSVIDLIAVNKGIDDKAACRVGYVEMLGMEWPSNGDKPSSRRQDAGKSHQNMSTDKGKKAASKDGKNKGKQNSDKDKTLKAAKAIERDESVERYQAKCEAFYDYTDYDGNPTFRVFRLPGKEFRQTTWNGSLYVNFKAVDVPQHLYNVQAVRKESSVVIVEGEKDADALIKLGICATTWPGGAKNLKGLLDTWDLFEPLRGKDIVFFAPDPDEVGEDAFEAAVPFISGYVDEFRKVRWPGEGIKDAHDFISQFDDIEIAKDEAWKVLSTAPEYVPGDIPNVLTRINRLKGMEIPPPTWVVEDIIQIGYTMVVGQSKARKTMFLHNLALAVATGGIAIGKFPTTRGTVIYCSLEDDLGSSQAKFKKMLGDEPYPSNLLVTCAVDRFPELEHKIVEWKRAFPDLNMVVLDNLVLVKKAKKGPAGSSHDYDNEYQEQNYFKKFARKLGIALIIVHHAGKNETGDITKDTLGTTAFVGAPDKLILIQRPVNQEVYNNTLTFLSRNSADQERMALKFHPDILSFNYLGPVEEFERTELQEQVLDLLSGNGKPMKPVDVARALGRKNDSTSKLLQRMEQNGLIHKIKKGLYQYEPPSQLN